MFAASTKILVADDMAVMRKLVAKVCKDLGYTQIIEVADGKEGWDKLNANPDIGLVISDWNMPNLSGLEFLKLVRATDKFKNLPFLLVTAEAEQSQIIEAVQANVSNYVVKPFTPATLTEKIGAVYLKHNGKKAA